MNSIYYIYLSLLIALIIAPLMTNQFFFQNSRSYKLLHFICLTILLTGEIFNIRYLVFVWPVFCVSGFIWHLQLKVRRAIALEDILTILPFVFSIVGSIWLTAGKLDVYLLGYSTTWSYFAVLHSYYIGWIFIGCLSFLVTTHCKKTKFYSYSCVICTLCFFSVAFGIYKTPVLKTLGAIGLSVIMPITIFAYFRETTKNTLSKALVTLSLIGIILSMVLALLNEFAIPIYGEYLDVARMLFYHGILNTVIVIPSFYLAIVFNKSTSLIRSSSQ